MSVQTCAAQLTQAMKELSLEWEQTRSDWSDAKSREFAEKFLDELPSHIGRTVAAMKDIETILRKVRADCE